MKKIIWIILFVVGLISAAFWQHENIPFLRGLFHKGMEVVQYTCPMHPQIVRDEPGTCPICGMTLVSIETKKEHKHSERAFLLSPERRQRIGVRTSLVEEKELKREVRLPGRVAYDQELYIAEQEYVQGLIAGVEREVLKAIENKLIRLGISDEELEKLKVTRKADASLYLPKEKGSFWIYVPVYESDIFWVEKGMGAQVSLPKDSTISFEGIVKQVAPVIDPNTRTAIARILVSNPKVSLRPESYVDVVLKKDLGWQLAIPVEAVIETGTKQIALLDLGEGYIEPREVRLGVKAGENYPVLEGLKAGEVVITSAHFLIDSEAALQTAIQRFGKPMEGHQH